MSTAFRARLAALGMALGLLLPRAALAEPMALPGHVDAAAPSPAAPSIWPRLVSGMQLGGEQRPEVQRFIRHYRANPAFFSVMLSRSEPFLWMVLQAIEQRGLPTELALLPAVESGWNPHAVSVSSAYGLWQFIPRTGKAYGLHDALNYDARRDPVASTAAAVQLLDELFTEYRNWPLALAAYNTGGVRLKQAMRTGRSRDYWRLPLPPVTREYVPRLLAIAALVRNPQRYGVSLPAIADHPAAELVALDPRTPLHPLLAAARVDPAVLRTYNPGLHDTEAHTHSPTLLLPPGDALALRAELAALDTTGQAQTTYRPDVAAFTAVPAATTIVASGRFDTRLHWATRLQVAAGTKPRHHRVRAGDTLFAIARSHGIAVAQLKRLNPALVGTSLRVDQMITLVDCQPSGCG